MGENICGPCSFLPDITDALARGHYLAAIRYVYRAEEWRSILAFDDEYAEQIRQTFLAPFYLGPNPEHAPDPRANEDAPE